MSKYLRVGTSGLMEEASAINTSAGAGDSSKLVQTGTDGKIHPSLIPGSEVITVVAGENISASDLVNIYDDGGVGKVRKADASSGISKSAVGYVLTTVTLGASVDVYFEGVITGLTGLTAGENYFLSATNPGKVTATPPATAGHICQYIGKARSSSILVFESDTPILRV
jgi:hypothetical protein